MALMGKHNLDNACAAALCARLLGIDRQIIERTLIEYRGLPHRMQFVAERSGVQFIDDSKATNVGAAVAAIQGLTLPGKVILIAGGRDKGGSYEPLGKQLAEVGRAAIVLGESANLLDDALSAKGVEVRRAKSMPEAVQVADELACRGDVVLLSPACSSFDMFRSYAERGDVFQTAVRELGGAA